VGGFVKMGHQESSDICSLLSLILVMLFYLSAHHQLSLFLFLYGNFGFFWEDVSFLDF